MVTGVVAANPLVVRTVDARAATFSEQLPRWVDCFLEPNRDPKPTKFDAEYAVRTLPFPCLLSATLGGLAVSVAYRGARLPGLPLDLGRMSVSASNLVGLILDSEPKERVKLAATPSPEDATSRRLVDLRFCTE